MFIQITQISSYSKHFLSSCEGKDGHIHSTYHKTINLKIGETILSLHPCTTPLSPIGMITTLDNPDFGHLSVQPGDVVKITTHTLQIVTKDSSLSFSYENAVSVETKLAKASDLQFVDFLYPAIIRSHTKGFKNIFLPDDLSENDPYFLIHSAAKQKIDRCLACNTSRDYDEITQNLLSLIGLGIGLTPSGDDFVCGILAGFILFDLTQHPLYQNLLHNLPEALNRTNDISRAFLQCALEQHFSKAILDITKWKSATELQNTYESIGHSSGIDTLCGIYFVHLFSQLS